MCPALGAPLVCVIAGQSSMLCLASPGVGSTLVHIVCTVSPGVGSTLVETERVGSVLLPSYLLWALGKSGSDSGEE